MLNLSLVANKSSTAAAALGVDFVVDDDVDADTDGPPNKSSVVDFAAGDAVVVGLLLLFASPNRSSSLALVLATTTAAGVVVLLFESPNRSTSAPPPTPPPTPPNKSSVVDGLFGEAVLATAVVALIGVVALAPNSSSPVGALLDADVVGIAIATTTALDDVAARLRATSSSSSKSSSGAPSGSSSGFGAGFGAGAAAVGVGGVTAAVAVAVAVARGATSFTLDSDMSTAAALCYFCDYIC